jgi:hypothetical protein
MIMIANPSLAPSQVEAFLDSGCQDLGPAGNDTQWGWGRVNVYRSVAQAISSVKYSATTTHYYERVTKPVTWTQAAAEAPTRSYYGVAGYLASINSSAENAFIVSNLDDYFIGTHCIGGYQPPASPEPAGNWQWVTAEPFSYSNWNAGEPNNGGGSEDRIEYWYGGSVGTWNDIPNSTVRSGYIVEYPVPPPVTISGSVTLQDLSVSMAGHPVVVEIKQAGRVVASYSTTLNGAGQWTVTTPWKGSFQAFVKVTHWLKKAVGTVVLNTTNVTGLFGSLINGDVDGDNGIDIGDYSVLSANFGSAGPTADLNEDGDVDIGDYSILSAHFGVNGDD